VQALLDAGVMLLLLGVANGSPIVARRLLGDRWGWPLDGGWRFFDGRPLLGRGKTWRGLVVATLATAGAAPLCGIPPALGACLGATSMAGDALASFLKRRLGLASGAECRGLDQVPEALLPLLVVAGPLGLSLLQVLGVTLVFYVIELPLARLLFRLGIRERPY
jgi:CDP-2,3-bis-(O-geranylgeranyl)-sn-glycerol synthase